MKNEKFVLASKKAGLSKEFELGTLPEASFKAIFAYGCQRFINDKLGGSDITKEEAAEMFNQLVEKLFSETGWTGRIAASKPILNPLDKIINDLAKERIKAALRAKNIPLKQVKDQMSTLLEAFKTKHLEVLTAQAQAILAASEGLDDLDLDLG